MTTVADTPAAIDPDEPPTFPTAIISPSERLQYLAGETSETFDPDEYVRSRDRWHKGKSLLATNSEYRRIATRLDPMLFALLYVRHHLRSEATRNEITFCDAHLDWCKEALGWAAPSRMPRADRDVFVAPRELGKSTWFFLILPLWAAAHGHRKFIAAFADSGTQAEMHLSTFKNELESNVLLQRDYPMLCEPATRRRGMTQSDTKGLTIRKSGFVFGARGADSKALGMKVGHQRPDMLICHQAGTPMLASDGTWRAVDEHPSFRGYRESESVQVRVWGLPDPEVVTPEHRYWAKWAHGQRSKYRDAEWVEARDLDSHHFIGYPVDTVVQPAPAIRVLRRRIDSRDSQGRVTSGAVYTWQEERPDFLDDPEFWWVVGLWWGDGHLSETSICFSMADKYPALKDRLEAYASRMNRSVAKTPKIGCTTYQWGWADVTRWLHTWYEGKSMKTPPPWVERLPLELQAALIEGYTDSDGMRDDVSCRVTSVHLPGLLVVRRMLARLGYAATIRKGPGPRHGFSGHSSRQRYDVRWNTNPVWRKTSSTHLADGFLWSKIRETSAGPVELFCPIQTADHQYITAFGLSHNCDDIEPGEDQYSEYQVQGRLTTIIDVIFPLSEYARVVLVGTVTLPGSIVHQLVKSVTEPDDDVPEWIGEQNMRVHYYPPIIANDDGTERSIWPAKWPIAYLQAIRHTRSFLKNFANSPMGMDGDYWSKDDFVYGQLEGKTRVMLSIDPAGKDKKTSDWTGLAVVGWAPPAKRTGITPIDPDDVQAAITGNLGMCEVMYAKAVKLIGERLRAEVLRILEMYPEIGLVLIEVNQGGEHWLDILHHLPCKIQMIDQSVDKRVRASQSLAHYQRRRVVHSARLNAAEEQMVSFPKGPNDDMVDAIGSAVTRLLRRPKKTGIQASNVGNYS